MGDVDNLSVPKLNHHWPFSSQPPVVEFDIATTGIGFGIVDPVLEFEPLGGISVVATPSTASLPHSDIHSMRSLLTPYNIFQAPNLINGFGFGYVQRTASRSLLIMGTPSPANHYFLSTNPALPRNALPQQKYRQVLVFMKLLLSYCSAAPAEWVRCHRPPGVCRRLSDKRGEAGGWLPAVTVAAAAPAAVGSLATGLPGFVDVLSDKARGGRWLACPQLPSPALPLNFCLFTWDHV
ncbi:hypothetical protein KSP40_PGU006074 [Platanthera guangdongensis]|uniref:Uncharacterized protein n=1 Tax=Platanthera guangdongensis TaxID=2320717 RepID=A0ABR2MZF1_9ASPA